MVPRVTVIDCVRSQPLHVHAWPSAFLFSLSSSLEREEAQGLLDSDSIDVWRAGDGGEMDFRVSSEQFQEMRDDHPGCREVGSVEALVKDEERRRADSASQQDWFKQYVSP